MILDEIGEVKPVLVNENYFKVYGIHVGGSGINEQYILNRTPAIVINDKVAMSMSLDENVIGKQITFYDKDFTIVGIYKKPDGFLRDISSDIYDRVYIPYPLCIYTIILHGFEKGYCFLCAYYIERLIFYLPIFLYSAW